MPIIYRKRSAIKPALAKKQAEEYERGKECPECGGELKCTDIGKDRNTYWCSGCNATSTFTAAPPKAKPSAGKRMNSITLRDKSKKKNYQKDQVAPIYTKRKTEKENLESIRSAMEKLSIMSFSYSSSGNTSTRNVEPYKITADSSGNLVLYGYDLDSNGIRVFKLRNMASLEVQPYTYKPRWDVEDKLKDKEDGS